MKRRAIYLSLVLLMVLGPVGCKPGLITSSSAQYGGIPYFLPKKVLELKITYTVRQKVQKVSGYEQEVQSPEIIIIKPIEVTPLVVADRRQTFYLIGKNVPGSAFFESSLSVNLGEGGNIESIGGEFKDKSLDVFQSILTAGIGIAKIVALAGPDKVEIPLDLKETIDRMPGMYKAIAELISKPDPGAKTKLEELNSQLSTLYELVKKYQENNKESFKETEYIYKEIVDPEKLTKDSNPDGKVTYSMEIKPRGIIKDATSEVMPPVKLTLFITDEEFKSLTTDFKTAMNTKEENPPGVVFRTVVPILAKITVNANNAMVYNGYISFPQFGKYSVIPIDSKRFTNLNTTLVFQSQSGALKEYKLVGGSSAENLSKQLSKTVDSLQQAVSDFNYNLKLQNLQHQKALTDAETELLKARKALEELKAKDK
jgi:hypothetical protein